MNPSPHFPPLRPLRPPPPYQPFPPPLLYQPAPASIYPFNPHSRHHHEAPSAPSSSTIATNAASASSASDLPTALSSLTSLLHLARATLNSISHLLPTLTDSSTYLVPCPFNPNHLVPPPSLFSHYLSCPSFSTPLNADGLLHSLHYPKSLHSSATTPCKPNENPSTAEFFFSLENFLNFSKNFFYSDCPGPVVVNRSDQDTSHSPPMLTLPELLCAECADFTCTSGCTDLNGLSVESIRLLPSETWAVREEMSGWGDYPASYSHRVLRAILRLSTSSLLCLPKWILVNSPKYSVIIDLAMRDHIVLLFKLCVKAIIREATNLASLWLAGEEREGEEEEVVGDRRKFDCPVLTNSMRWLHFQLSVLYGELNGKIFTINMLKQCVLDSALNSSIFPVEERTQGPLELEAIDGKLEGPIGKIEGDKQKNVENVKGFHSSIILVSQVAAAVAALHERCWLERKIKALRETPPFTSHQRMVEHEYMSKRANDERQKRSNYRPVIEHDGLLRKQTQNLEQNRTKTREELLAEERDYKRRRMSYRGKKIKRSTLQVMREIIDEFMEEIVQASNIAEGAKELESKLSVHDSSSDVFKSQKNQLTFGASRVDSHGYGNHMHAHDHRSIGSEKYLGDDEPNRHECQQRHRHLENDRDMKRGRLDRRDYSRSPDRWLSKSGRSIRRARHERKEYSRSPDQRHSGSHSQRHRTGRENRDDPEITKEKCPQSSDRSHSISYAQKSHRGWENKHNSEQRDKHTRRGHRDSRLGLHVEFEDRYTPSESHDTYGVDT